MGSIDWILDVYYGFLFSSVISFARLFTQRCKSAFYEKSRKSIKLKWKYILSGRSRCDHCQKVISPLYLMPVLGYLFSIGKCSQCGKKISKVYFIEESLAFFYGMLYFFSARLNLDHHHVSTIFAAMYFFLCYFIASIDYKYFNFK